MPVTREDVVWCYQTFFDREPESETPVEHHMRNTFDWKALVQVFLASAEYQQKRLGLTPEHFVYDDKSETQRTALAILKMVEPMQVIGFDKIRVGGDGDGGYVMIDDFGGVDAAYSLGIKDDVRWDLEIAKKGIEVYQYDHTIDALPATHKNFHWFKTGISAKPAEGYDSLPNLMALNGHAKSRNLLLKCDIEGYEWDMFAAMTPAQLAQFSQIVVEFHGFHELGKSRFAKTVKTAFANLAVNHRLVHVHGNNNTPMAIVGNLPMPVTMEMNFVRLVGKTMVPSQETFPTKLDTPCWPHRADLSLGTFRFS